MDIIIMQSVVKYDVRYHSICQIQMIKNMKKAQQEQTKIERVISGL